MPHLLFKGSELVHASETARGACRRFAELTGAQISWELPRAVFDSAANNRTAEQPESFQAENGWHVVMDGVAYSVHAFERDHLFYYVHRVLPTAEGAPAESYEVYGYDDDCDYVAARIGRASKSELVHAIAVMTSTRSTFGENGLCDFPLPALKFAANLYPEGAKDDATFTYRQQCAIAAELKSKWVCGPQKEYGVYVTEDALQSPMPFMWLIGYNISPRAEAFYALRRGLGARADGEMRGSFIWSDSISGAATSVLSYFRRDSQDVPSAHEDERGTLTTLTRMCMLLCYAHQQIPPQYELHHAAHILSTNFKIRSSTAPPHVSREAEWFLGVALREY